MDVAPADDSNLGAAMAHEYRRLVRLCEGVTGRGEAADDLAQETLTEAWRCQDRPSDPAGLSPWLIATQYTSAP